MQIVATASMSSGKVKSLEILFNDEVLRPDEGSTAERLTKTITEAGWYKVKATGENGRVRYAWVRVTSLTGELEPPTIEESNGIHGIEGWYRDGLEVTISSNDETVTSIHYLVKSSESRGTTDNEGDWQTQAGNSVTFSINTLR